MKLSHLSVLVALCASVPSIASAITISNATQLATALKTAKGGEIFDLAPGNYGTLSLNNKNFSVPVTFRSLNATKPAVFAASTVAGSSGINFNNVTFANTSGTGFAVRMGSSSNISFNNVSIHGSLDNNASNDGAGLYIAYSSGISVTNSQFTQLSRGIGVDKSSSINLVGNSIYGIRSDGINMAQVQNVKISGNQFKDFSPVAGDHPDAIQFWTSNTTASSKNIEISNNLIVGKLGAQMQGIFIGDQTGGKLPYSNITIKDNTLVGTGWHGIALSNANAASVTGNVLVTIAGSTVTSTWINLSSVAGLLSGNTAKTFIVKTSPDLKQSGNTTNITSASLAEQVLQAWYAANKPVLPGPDEVAEAPIGSNTSTNANFTAPTPTPESPVLLTSTAFTVVPVSENAGTATKEDAFSKASTLLKQTSSGKKGNSASGVLSAVPEPATWAQLLLGFGLVGWLTRRARGSTRTSVG